MTFVASLRARARERPRRIVLAEGEDPRVIEAAGSLLEEEWVTPLLVGDRERVRAALDAAGVAPDRVQVLDPSDPDAREVRRLVARGTPKGAALRPEVLERRVSDPLAVAALAVAGGEADGSVAGAIHPTAEVLRHALRWVGKAEGISTVSSAFYMVVAPFRGPDEEVLTFTDAAVVPDPGPAQLVDIAAAAVDARRRIVGDRPVVGFLSYSTLGSARGPRVTRVRDAVALFRRRFPDVPVEGELQGDAALIPAVAARKAPESESAGRANVLVFPDLDSANIAYKLVERLAGATALGPIVQGLAAPCNDLSRGASSGDIVDVACITSLMAD